MNDDSFFSIIIEVEQGAVKVKKMAGLNRAWCLFLRCFLPCRKWGSRMRPAGDFLDKPEGLRLVYSGFAGLAWG